VHAQEVVLKVAHFWPTTALSHQKVLLPWCDKIARESANRLKCQIYPAMQLGTTPPATSSRSTASSPCRRPDGGGAVRAHGFRDPRGAFSELPTCR